MSLQEAWQGAKAELANLPGPVAKARRCVAIARTFATEFVGLVQLAPYAAGALGLHRRLSELQHHSDCRQPRDHVAIVKNVSYGSKARQKMDIYLPPQDSKPGEADAPVACFVHGGVWAVGDRWQYAPLGQSLAEAGVVTVIPSYTLFPQALIPQMVSEVQEALSFTIERAASWGGDPSRITLVGHSAGAQLAMMALLQRAKDLGTTRQKGTNPELQSPCTLSQSAGTVSQSVSAVSQSVSAPQQRMPKRFIGMAGVYDLTKHFAYENERQVGELSTMKRAAGGVAGFPSCSPAVIVAQAVKMALSQSRNPSAAASHRKVSSLQGEALATRIGFERPRDDMACQLASTEGPTKPIPLQLSVAQIRRLPPVVLMSSCTDVTVPWYQSAEMFWMLLDGGCLVKHLCYPFAGHSDFVIAFPSQTKQASKQSMELPSQCSDLLAILTEDAEEYCCQKNAD